MRIEENYSLKHHNTFHLPVKTRWFIEYESEEELSRILRDEYFQEQFSLHIGEGSNLLFQGDFNGVIFHSQIKGIEVVDETDYAVWLRVGAAEHWDDVVAYAVEKGWGGIENLSNIPGEAGAAALQNIGAYGVEIKDVIEKIEAYNQFSVEKRVFTNAECEYAYRYSYFKDPENEPYIITYIVIRLTKIDHRLYTKYGNLNERLTGKEVTPANIRETVIAIRNEKLPDPEEIGYAGSFFMNPIVDKETFETIKNEYPSIPSYAAGDDLVKIPAGWLIEQCGYKGERVGDVGTYEKQALVIVNYGNAKGYEIVEFAGEISEAVKDKFGIELRLEVKIV